MPRHRMPAETRKKHATIQEFKERQMDEKSVTGDKSILESNRYPKTLCDKISRAEYKRIKPRLLEINMVCDLDMTNIIGYCNAYSCYIKSTIELTGQELTVENDRGNMVPNPLINIQKKYADEMRRFESLIGMTAGSRLAVAGKKRESERSEIEKKFGAI